MAFKPVLGLLLKGTKLVSIHTKTVSKQSILTQRDELQRRVDAWGLDNSQALFIACSNDVCKYLFDFNEKPISEYTQCLGASLIGSDSGPYQTRGIRSTERAVEEKPKSKGFRILQRGTYKNCLLYTSPSPRDRTRSRMPSSA